MLRRMDRILLRVSHVGAGVRFYRDVMGMRVVKEEGRLALLRFADGEGELVLHDDPNLPDEAVYYLVEDVRKLYERREELKLVFVQAPTPAARGYRAAVKDPFGNVLLIVDRTAQQAAIEDGKPPGALFAGVEERSPLKREELVEAYRKVGRTADDLPYTPDFERLYGLYAAKHRDPKPTRQEVWRHILTLRKSAQLPKLGEARSRPPEMDEASRARLRELLGPDIGKRDRLPYSERFERLVDEFNATQARPLSPHLVWRMVATLAK